jgi:hypothetical protein
MAVARPGEIGGQGRGTAEKSLVSAAPIARAALARLRNAVISPRALSTAARPYIFARLLFAPI